MSEKKSIRIPVSNGDKLINVELKNDIDLLEILSLKFTQTDIYSSGLCSDYGVVCGRVSANNGLGIPNAKVSIFVPLDNTDEIDPVISALYPYKSTTDKDDDGYRYNLLPKRKQHGGHNPTGTFFDQEDILSHEEYLEVFEKYYNYTAKTNDSGDFMIWGVPVGTQTIHIDVDLSDIGCFSLRPYDFIRKGVGEDKFERTYAFKSSSDIDGLPQIVRFEKTIEIYPFIGNEELCEIGISRVDFDLTEADIKIEPVSLILVSTITDDNSKAIKKSGEIITKSGYKCNLQTTEGKIESVRFTGGKVYGSDGTLYPELEYFNVTETINQNGVAMVVLPMNIDYVYTNEFGEQEVTSDKNKGIPTKCISRFRFGLNNEGNSKTTAKYLVPNIREFNYNVNGKNNDDTRYGGEYDRLMVLSYMFSNVYEDYLKIPDTYSGVTFNPPVSNLYKSHKNNLMLNVDEQTNEIVPLDYFYKFTYGKVYTVSSFQGSHYQGSQLSNFIQTLTGAKRRDSFLGIKEVRPNEEDDCAGSTNYFPVNYGFRNNIKFSLIINEILLLLQFIFYVITTWIYENLGSFFIKIAKTLGSVSSFAGGDIDPLKNAADDLLQLAFKVQEFGQTVLPLTTYPDCDECTTDVNIIGYNQNINFDYFCRSEEIKTKIVVYSGNTDTSHDGVYLVYNNGQIPSWINTGQTSGTTYLTELYPIDAARETCATGITENQLVLLDNYYLNSSTTLHRFVGDIYYKYDDVWRNFSLSFGTTNYQGMVNGFDVYNNVGEFNINYVSKVSLIYMGYGSLYKVLYDGLAPEPIQIDIATGGTGDPLLTVVINAGNSEVTYTATTMGTISNAYPTTSKTAIRFDIDDWVTNVGELIYNQGSSVTHTYVRLYDTQNVKSNTGTTSLTIEQGCQKYDKFFNESYLLTYIWSSGNTAYDQYGIDYPPTNGGIFFENDNNWHYRSFNPDCVPLYNTSNYREQLTSPGGSFTIIATAAGDSTTYRLPQTAATRPSSGFDWHSYKKKTKSGLTEIRDGVFIIVPVIKGKSYNQSVITEWYKRKRIGLFFCSGVINYTFIDNWLNGLLYFFKFNKKIVWDDEEKYDLGQRTSKFPRDLVFFNILDNTFYYRSTPYNPITQKFIGQKVVNSDHSFYYELLHPTTFYDIGVRDEFFYEICTDPALDPTCSVARDITSTSYQDPANIVEYGLNYLMDISNGSTDVDDFFKSTDFNKKLTTFNGDFIQLMSINSESGIEAFDLDNSQYFMYNGEIIDPEESIAHSYFTSGGTSYGPLPIDFKLDVNGKFIRGCLNYRLGDYSQPVPFYLWDKKGNGFGSYNSNRYKQMWDRTSISSMPLQRIFSVSATTATTSNYLMTDGEEEYLLRPMTINHNTILISGNTIDSIDRFTYISTGLTISIGLMQASGYTESELFLHVTSGTTKDPLVGDIYVVVNQTWVKQNVPYIKDVNETFIYQTAQNYTGNKQVLSTPFMFYFGLRPQNTALDLLTKYYGPKGVFPPTD